MVVQRHAGRSPCPYGNHSDARVAEQGAPRRHREHQALPGHPASELSLAEGSAAAGADGLRYAPAGALFIDQRSRLWDSAVFTSATWEAKQGSETMCGPIEPCHIHAAGGPPTESPTGQRQYGSNEGNARETKQLIDSVRAHTNGA
jgi:hypothetical protein